MSQSPLQPAAQPEPEMIPSDCIFQTILTFLLPFFLIGAEGDANLAGAAIFELIDAYDAATVKELDLAGRIIAFSTIAMDNLRLSMSDPEMSHTKILQYRGNAVALSRMAEQCRTVLDAMQARRQQTRMPLGMQAAASMAAMAPLAAAQPVEPPKPQPSASAPAERPDPAQASQVLEAGREITDIESMKLNARRMIEALHAQGSSISDMVDPLLPDPSAAAKAAADSMLAAAGIPRIQPVVTGTRC